MGIDGVHHFGHPSLYLCLECPSLDRVTRPMGSTGVTSLSLNRVCTDQSSDSERARVAMRCRDPAGQFEVFVRVLHLKTFN